MEPPADYKEGGRLKWPKWEVSPFGESIPHATCFNDFQDNGDLNCCGGSFGSLVQGCQGADTRIFKFNRNTLRFLESSNEGYFAQGNTYQPPKTPEMTDEQKEAELSTLSKEGRAGLEKALKGLEETRV